MPDRLQLVLGGVTDEVAFAELAVRRSSAAEQELAAWLQDVHGRQVAVAFGTGDARAKSDSSRQDASAVSWWQSVARDVTVLARRIALCCSPTTWVESRVGEDIVGRSLLGLGGELRTAWRAGTGCDEVRLHCGSLALISASRSALLRVLALAAQGALAISVRLALPGGAVIALPAAWRFAHRVMQETGGLGSLERPVRT